MPKILRLLVFVFLTALTAGRVIAAPSHPNDMARYLAGLQPSAGSPAAQAAYDPAWQAHARDMNRAWGELERDQINRVRVWASANLPPSSPAMFYMFSGPDFLHAEAFYPGASTYVLAGLEPIGDLPDVAEIPPARLEGLRASLNNFLTYGYFITREMNQQFQAGTLPLLYVFMARAGKTIQSVSYVQLSGKGTVAVSNGNRNAEGVRIIFTGRDGRPQTLYYFRTDLSNGGVAKSGILKFCASLGTGDSLVKSASYLMHNAGFSHVRDFLLTHSAVVIQDDSGIPLRYFDRSKWRLHPYGQYLEPIEVFKKRYQPDMAQLFAGATPVNFGIGYRWHPTRTNVLLAIRGNKANPRAVAPPAAQRRRIAPRVNPPPPAGEPERRGGPLRRLFRRQ